MWDAEYSDRLVHVWAPRGFHLIDIHMRRNAKARLDLIKDERNFTLHFHKVNERQHSTAQHRTDCFPCRVCGCVCVAIRARAQMW